MHPPRKIIDFLRWFCRVDCIEEIEGDLVEIFKKECKASPRRAKWKVAWRVIRHFRPEFIKPVKIYHPNPNGMYKSYFKIGWRNLWKNKFSSAINVFGLSIGLASCLMIALYIKHEAGYDAFQPNGDRIARVIMEYAFDGSPETKRGNFTSTKVAPVFARTFPEVELSIRMDDAAQIVYHDGQAFSEVNFLYTDSTFFDLFAATFLQGNPHNALDGPRKVVLSESTARRYFGDESALNKILLVGSDSTAYEITGVVKDYPTASQIKFDFLASFSSLGENQEETYFEANFTTYLLLKDGRALPALQNKITRFMKQEMAGSGASINYILEPFDEIHLHSEFAAFVPNTSITYLYILSGVALLIMVIVCFTYINLSTARSLERAKEIGIRKVSGANRPQLFAQFIGESLLLFAMAMLIGVGIVALVFPYFNELTGQSLSLQSLLSPWFMLSAFVLAVVVSFLAGSYPAMLLSRFIPAVVLKGVFKHTHAGKWVQQTLTVFQFTISALLIVSTLIMQGQLYFIQHKNLGYDRSHILTLPMNQQVLDKLEVIKQALKSNDAVHSVSRCVSSPVMIAGGYNMRTAAMSANEQISVNGTPIDEEYIRTTGLQIISGRDLTEQDIKDISAPDPSTRVYHFILNESAARALGWSAQDAVGNEMYMGYRHGTVRAVVADFHFQSMHEAIKPVVLFPEIRSHGQVLIKISSDDMAGTISFVESTLHRIVPGVPFEYRFLDDAYDKLYKSELKLGTVMNLFSGIAILLACLGLLGLSAYTVQQRLKEIGIRKILGATPSQIIYVIARNFVVPIVASLVIAGPLAYWLMDRWLQGFTYHIDIAWWMFATTGALVVVTACGTIAIHAAKAAATNPANSLRSE